MTDVTERMHRARDKALKNQWNREEWSRGRYIRTGYNAGLRFNPYTHEYHLTGRGETLTIHDVASACETTDTVVLRRTREFETSIELTVEDFVRRRMQVMEGAAVSGDAILRVWAHDAGDHMVIKKNRRGYYARLYTVLEDMGIHSTENAVWRTKLIEGYTLIP